VIQPHHKPLPGTSTGKRQTTDLFWEAHPAELLLLSKRGYSSTRGNSRNFQSTSNSVHQTCTGTQLSSHRSYWFVNATSGRGRLCLPLARPGFRA